LSRERTYAHDVELRAKVLIVSDACSRGERDDVAGPLLTSRLEAASFVVVECRVVPDGVDSVAFFFTATDAAAAGAALQERASVLPPHQRPRWWHLVDDLPRGPTGKLLRRKLRELHRTLE